MTSVTIIGAGIFGLSCGWEMSRRGARVHIIEAERIGAGSSGGHVGALAPHAPDNWNDKKAFQLASLIAAPDFWGAVEAASGQSSGFGRTGRLQPIPDADAADRLGARIDAAAARWPAGCGMRLVETPGTGLVPDSPSGLWLRDDLTARLNPRAACAALAAAIRATGGTVTQGVAPDDPATVILWATGTPGLLALGRNLGRVIGKGVKGQSALLRHEAPNAPQIFADGLHIVPHTDGSVAIGSTSENDYDSLDPDDQIEPLIAKARRICPQLESADVIDRWAGARPRARSRAPILGPWPGRPGHFVANGGFKIGFGMAPKIAEVMADLILEGRDAIPHGFRLT